MKVRAIHLLIACAWLAGCGNSDGLDLYRKTNNQPGHEHVKTEQFIVPVGSVIVLKGLDFAPGVTTLTDAQSLVVHQVFNSLEEVTENTVGDNNAARVTEFKAMEFEIRAYLDGTGNSAADTAAAEARAKAVLTQLTNAGTPAWRLKTATASDSAHKGIVAFVRTR